MIVQYTEKGVLRKINLRWGLQTLHQVIVNQGLIDCWSGPEKSWEELIHLLQFCGKPVPGVAHEPVTCE